MRGQHPSTQGKTAPAHAVEYQPTLDTTMLQRGLLPGLRAPSLAGLSETYKLICPSGKVDKPIIGLFELQAVAGAPTTLKVSCLILHAPPFAQSWCRSGFWRLPTKQGFLLLSSKACWSLSTTKQATRCRSQTWKESCRRSRSRPELFRSTLLG